MKPIYGWFVCLALLTLPLAAQAEILRFRQLADGIYRGAQPSTVEDYRYLKRIGVKTILNLRADDTVATEKAIGTQLSMRVLNIPMSGFFSPSEAAVKQAHAILNNPKLRPVFFHCQFGKDRTGVIAGLYRIFFQHWGPLNAYDEMLSLGYNSSLLGLEYYFWEHSGWERPFDQDILTR